MEPIIFLLSAPSGSGKTSVVDACLGEMPQVERVITHTTRLPRTNIKEKHGEDYFFVSDEEFDHDIAAGKFLEWQNLYQYKYGTSIEQVERIIKKNKHALLVIDVLGAEQVRSLGWSNLCSIFLHVPSAQEILARLKKRNSETGEELLKRLQRYEQEIKHRFKFDFVLLNYDLEDTKQKFKEIICAFPLNHTSST